MTNILTNLMPRLSLPVMAVAAFATFSIPATSAEASMVRGTAIETNDSGKVTLVAKKKRGKKGRHAPAFRAELAHGSLTLEFGNGPRYGGKRHLRRYHTCNPRRALRKAQRRGIRHAHIRRINGRGVVVAGRKWGERVVIGFANHRSCPVRFVRARGGRR